MEHLRLDVAAARRQIVEIKGVKVRLGRHLSRLVIQSFLDRDYEREKLEIVASKLSSDDVVIELGTGLGVLSAYCAKRVGSWRVTTYEANPALEPYIRGTFALNGVAPNLHMCLLGESPGERIFFVGDMFWASSPITESPDALAIAVPVKSLNDEIRRVRPTFLIMDVEGVEDELTEFIDYQTIRKVVVELHPAVLGREKVREVKARFLNAGFVVDSDTSIAEKGILFLRRD